MRSPMRPLSEQERQALIKLSHSLPQNRGIALRARIVLRCAAKQTNSAVASEFGVSLHTVGKWRRRYLDFGLEGLKDQPRSGKPRQFEWDSIAKLIEATLASTPPHGDRWTVRQISSAVGVPTATTARIWHYSRTQRHHSTGDTCSSIAAAELELRSAGASSLKASERSHSSDSTATAPCR
jgi:putative transposase